jgi:copper oxidase (laccase) domain-containing protein
MVTEDKMFVQAANLAGIDGVAHGFFTRLGGVSEDIYASLNCGLGSRDIPESIVENRARAARILGTDKLWPWAF